MELALPSLTVTVVSSVPAQGPGAALTVAPPARSGGRVQTSRELLLGRFFVLLLGLCRTFAEVTKLSHAYTRNTSVTAGPTFSPATAVLETLAVAQSPAAVF